MGRQLGKVRQLEGGRHDGPSARRGAVRLGRGVSLKRGHHNTVSA